MRRLLYGMIVLSVTSLGWAGVVETGGGVSGGATCRPTVQTFDEVTVLGEAVGSANLACHDPFQPGLTYTGFASASVDLLGALSPDIEGRVGATGPPGTLLPHEAAASTGQVQATLLDTVHIHPPRGYTGGPLGVIAGSDYHINISGQGDEVSGVSAQLAYAILWINGVPVPPSSTYADSAFTSADGSYSGRLHVDFTIPACPCSFKFGMGGEATASFNSTASFSDPIFIDLPPGWTYTLASQDIATPEPSTLVLLGSSLLGVAGILRRKLFR